MTKIQKQDIKIAFNKIKDKGFIFRGVSIQGNDLGTLYLSLKFDTRRTIESQRKNNRYNKYDEIDKRSIKRKKGIVNMKKRNKELEEYLKKLDEYYKKKIDIVNKWKKLENNDSDACWICKNGLSKKGGSICLHCFICWEER